MHYSSFGVLDTFQRSCACFLTGIVTNLRIFHATIYLAAIHHMAIYHVATNYAAIYHAPCLTRYSDATFGRLAGDNLACLLSRPLTAPRLF
jgi:hypothetical protein